MPHAFPVLHRRPVAPRGAAGIAGLLCLASLIAGMLACVRAPVPAPRAQSETAEESGPPDRPRNPLHGELDATYGVVGVSELDVLPVRQIAGSGGMPLEELAWDARGIRLTGISSLLGSSLWIEILTPAGTVGWVNASNVTELLPDGTLCDDAAARKLVDDVGDAVRTQDMSALAVLLAERRGLNLRLSPGGPTVTITRADVPLLLQTPAVRDWGPDSTSGDPVTGSFAEVIQPRLEAVFAHSPQVACNEILHGPTAQPPGMPAEFRNMEYFSAYLPSQASETGMDWQTWGLIVELEGGIPRLAALIRFRGEI